MPNIESSRTIRGVTLVHLSEFGDQRGRMIETFRQEWLPGAPPMIQGNRSDSKRGVIRALHFHRRQSDYWYCPAGRLFVALHDLRRNSATRGGTQTLEIGDGSDVAVYIPPGVAHGFQAMTDATLTYLVDRYYDSSDEFGLAWDDPQAAIPWPIPDPILSQRDRNNPKRSDIAEEDLPG